MGQISLSSLKEDKALIFANRHGTFKQRLEEIGASLNGFTITYDDSKKSEVEEIIKEVFEVHLPR